MSKTSPSVVRRILRDVRDRTRKVKNDLVWTVRRQRVAQAIDRAAQLPSREALRGSTLFFVPYAGVTPMFSQTCVVARTLQERGHRVFVARCFRLFDRCPSMDNDRLPFDADAERKRESCLHCADNSLSMAAAYNLEAVDLRALVTPEIIARIDRAMSVTSPDLIDFEFDGLSFGKLSVMDVVLARKISEFGALDEKDKRAWREYLRSCLLGHLITDRLCGEFRVGRVVHCNDYSLLLGVRTAARKHHIPCYGLAFPGHRNVDLRRYLILPNVWKPTAFKLRANWPACRELALDPARVREVAEDLLVRFGGIGSHIYSPGKTVEQADIRRRMGLADDRKLIVAYTSSFDEVIATRMGVKALGIEIPDRPQPFATQIEWLKTLTKCVEESDDLQLVVRIHPREGVNKRESVASQHLGQLKSLFGGTFSHCRFVWPEDRVSSYDLGEAADLVLTSWSTIGLEMARLGAPVLVAFNGADVAIAEDDFLEWAPTPPKYLEKLRLLLERPIGLDQIARAFRWYSLSALGASVDLTDVVPRSDFSKLPEFKLPNETETIERILLGGEDVCDINIERLQKQQMAESQQREREALLVQLRRIVHFLMTGENPTTDVLLAVASLAGRFEGNGSSQPTAKTHSRLMRTDGRNADYQDGERIFRRYSPMAARLALLCGSSVETASPVGGRT